MTGDNLSSLSLRSSFCLRKKRKNWRWGVTSISSDAWAGIWQEIPGNFLYLNVQQPTSYTWHPRPTIWTDGNIYVWKTGQTFLWRWLARLELLALLRTLLVLLLVLPLLPVLVLPRLLLDLLIWSWRSWPPNSRDIPILWTLWTAAQSSLPRGGRTTISVSKLPVPATPHHRVRQGRATSENISVFSLTQIRQLDKSQPFKVISFVYLQHRNCPGLVDALMHWAPIDPAVVQIQMFQGLTSVLINVLRHLNIREISRLYNPSILSLESFSSHQNIHLTACVLQSYSKF